MVARMASPKSAPLWRRNRCHRLFPAGLRKACSAGEAAALRLLSVVRAIVFYLLVTPPGVAHETRMRGSTKAYITSASKFAKMTIAATMSPSPISRL